MVRRKVGLNLFIGFFKFFRLYSRAEITEQRQCRAVSTQLLPEAVQLEAFCGSQRFGWSELAGGWLLGLCMRKELFTWAQKL